MSRYHFIPFAGPKCFNCGGKTMAARAVDVLDYQGHAIKRLFLFHCQECSKEFTVSDSHFGPDGPPNREGT